MNRGNAAVLAGLAVTLSMSVAQAASGSAADTTEDPTTLPRVNVETSKAKTLASPKYTAPLAETTQTIQVIDSQLLKTQGATTLTEAMRNVPGVGTFNAGEGNGGPNMGDALYMRGFDASNSIFVDGVRDLGSITRDVFNIEQVEITKGAAGTDTGRSAPSGQINLVSKQPNLDDHLNAALGLGSGSYKRSTLDWNQKLSGFDNGAAVRLNVMGQDAGVAGRDQVKNKSWGVAPSIAFGLKTDTRVYVNLLHVKQTNTPDSGLPTVGLSGFSDTTFSSASKVDTSNYYGSTDSHDDATATMATLRVEHDLSPTTTLRNLTRWGKNESDYLAVTAGVASLSGSDTSTWTTTRLGAAKQLKNEVLTNQTSLTTKFNTGTFEHSLSTGVEWTREKQTNYGLTRTGSLSSVNLYNPTLTASGLTITRSGLDAFWQTDTAAAYVFDTVKLNRDWQVNGALRVDHYKTSYLSEATTGNTELEADGNLVTYKVGALYKVAPTGNVYANYALSQQPPGSTSSFGAYSLSSTASSASNPDMDPQKSKTYELGTKWEFFDKRLLITGALFRTDVENEVYAEDDGTYSQIGKKRVQGIELSATGQITKDWNVVAAYTHQKTKIVTGAATAQDGTSTLPYAPDNALSLWTTYRLPQGLTLGGGARYTGIVKRQTKLATTPDHIPSYWVFDAVATYEINKNWDAQLNVFNLFDKRYITAINYLGYRYTPGLERSARVNLNYHF
ncbi:catecholate siderophore receptor Fiu [Roseateles sp. SL47]|uniref:catecholate siderophore receptor Fiu n=1 Tax=Roseateles sp. SL47 TaxID=2995138 RepID=UPI00226DA8E0|nr:catecholate siderophore receptor Fiu [Roseateles sp. SL47]WAC70745.1 catecholate siderophore receptor Fiu [Roseateles sp. SL47]